jgi:hypothetical protein
MKALGYVAGRVDINPNVEMRAGRLEVGDMNEVTGIQASVFQNDHPHFFPLSHFFWNVGDSLNGRIAQYEGTAIKAGDQYDSTDRHEIRYLCALLLLLHQKLLAAPSEKMDYDRAARRRMVREKWEPVERIRVIRYRRYTYHTLQQGQEHRQVDWKFRWVVRGHWRNQWFTKDQEHRPVYIHQFVKGPPDRPMKDPSRLFAAVR